SSPPTATNDGWRPFRAAGTIPVARTGRNPDEDYRFASRTRFGTRFARADVLDDGSSAYRLRHTMISVVSLSGSIRVSNRSIGYNTAPTTFPEYLFLLSGCTTFIHIFRRAGRGESTGPSIRANAGRRRTSWNPASSSIRSISSTLRLTKCFMLARRP